MTSCADRRSALALEEKHCSSKIVRSYSLKHQSSSDTRFLWSPNGSPFPPSLLFLAPTGTVIHRARVSSPKQAERYDRLSMNHRRSFLRTHSSCYCFPTYCPTGCCASKTLAFLWRRLVSVCVYILSRGLCVKQGNPVFNICTSYSLGRISK